jgi:membrane-associated phospholipid phosphatase
MAFRTRALAALLALLLAAPGAARAEPAGPPAAALVEPGPSAPTGSSPVEPGSAAPTAPATSGPPRLTVELGTAAAVTGTELALIGLSVAFKDQLVASSCRWCQPPQLDLWARGELRWNDTQAASTASDVLQLLIPAGAAATLWVQAAPHGNREVVEDLLVFTESVSTTILLTQGAKYAVLRLRPDAWARGTVESPDDKLSFWSGHTGFAFGAAAAATQIARLRGRSGWKWLAAASFGAAAVTGYLRVAADRHWLTDVAAGAVAGTATGLVVPLLVFQPADGRKPAVSLAPAPGGLAVIF